MKMKLFVLLIAIQLYGHVGAIFKRETPSQCAATCQAGKMYPGWKLVFKASAGIQKSVFDAWKNRADCTTIDINSLYADTEHWKSSIVDNWCAHGIKKVLLVLAKCGQEVKRFEFNGEGTDNMNWFHGSKLLSSPYTDLTGNPQFFSIEGDTLIRVVRRFFINANYRGCSNDNGWLCVVDSETEFCDWEKGDEFPKFIYSPTTTMYNWQGDVGGQGRADVMAIFVQN